MKQGILIDLTALLDVVMNLMFLVLVTTTQQMDAVQAQSQADASAAASLAKQVGELREQNAGLLRKVDSYMTFERDCCILTVSIDKATRTVLAEGGNAAASRIPLTWENGQYARNLLKSELGRRGRDSLSGSSQFVFIVFQYDRNSVYQADYLLVDAAIQAQKVFGDVYFAEYDIMEAGADEGAENGE
jgi:hypothetical protein